MAVATKKKSTKTTTKKPAPRKRAAPRAETPAPQPDAPDLKADDFAGFLQALFGRARREARDHVLPGMPPSVPPFRMPPNFKPGKGDAFTFDYGSGQWKHVPADQVPPHVREIMEREGVATVASARPSPMAESVSDLLADWTDEPPTPPIPPRRPTFDPGGRPMTHDFASRGNPKQAFGTLKDCAHFVPMDVMLNVMRVFRGGSDKYGLKNYRVQPVAASTYYDAAIRHLISWFEAGEDADDESAEHHLSHVIACCMIVLDARNRGMLIDDRDAKEAKYPNT